MKWPEGGDEPGAVSWHRDKTGYHVYAHLRESMNDRLDALKREFPDLVYDHSTITLPAVSDEAAAGKKAQELCRVLVKLRFYVALNFDPGRP